MTVKYAELKDLGRVISGQNLGSHIILFLKSRDDMSTEPEQHELSLSNPNKGTVSESDQTNRNKAENHQGKYKSLQSFMSLSPISTVFTTQSAAISTRAPKRSLPSKLPPNLIIVRAATAISPRGNSSSESQC